MRRERKPPEAGRRDVTWHDSKLEREQRWHALETRGATVWLTGLPASGKSTIAAELERRLVESGRPAYLLDGDNVRHGLSDDVGFEPGDRSEHIRRVAHVARLLADAGVVAVVSLVSPTKGDRQLARGPHDAAGLDFHAVWVSTPGGGCERRAPQGLSAKGGVAPRAGGGGPPTPKGRTGRDAAASWLGFPGVAGPAGRPGARNSNSDPRPRAAGAGAAGSSPAPPHAERAPRRPGSACTA